MGDVAWWLKIKYDADPFDLASFDLMAFDLTNMPLWPYPASLKYTYGDRNVLTARIDKVYFQFAEVEKAL